MILPEIINEGWVGTQSVCYPGSTRFSFDISGLIDRSQQIDKILVSTDLIIQCLNIKLIIGPSTLIDFPVNRYSFFEEICGNDGWFDLFKMIDLPSLAPYQLQFHKISIVPQFGDQFISAYRSSRKEIEVQEKCNIYVWNEGEDEQILDTENGYYQFEGERVLDDDGYRLIYAHSRIEQYVEDVEITIETNRLPANMIRVEQSFPESIDPEAINNCFSWIPEFDFLEWQTYNQREKKLGEVCRSDDGYLKCPNVFKTKDGMGALCYVWP